MNPEPTPEPVAIALGSNLGDREALLERATDELDRVPGLELRALSSMYESAPWGDTDQGPFLNAVAGGECTLPPAELLRATQQIEQRLGKRVLRPWGPRAIDLDVLLYGSRVVAGDALTLPHPHIRARPFVVLPLAEIAGRLPGADWQHFLQPDEAGRACLGETRALDPRPRWPSQPVPRQWETDSQAEETTRRLGARIGEATRPGDLFALCGPLGAGKSCFVRGIARGLGLKGPIPSPTYTLCREYTEGRIPFQHWDFYRLGDGGDLESTGFPDKAEESAAIAIEWAGLFREQLPVDGFVEIHIQRDAQDDSRRLRFRFPPGSLHLRVALASQPSAEPFHARSGN